MLFSLGRFCLDDLSCSRSVIVVVTISIKLGSTLDACKTIICS